MGAAFFYHLTRSSVEETLGQLLPKALGAGWRVELRGTDQARMETLDQALWLGPEEGFLPHGLAGGAHDDLQPILLTTQSAQGADCVTSIDGAGVSPEEVAACQRVMILFDGGDGVAKDHARGQWRALTEAGCAAQYWSQDSGKWEKKAES